MTVKEVIAITFAYYNPGNVLDQTVLEIYAEDLADLNEQAVMLAYQTYRRDPNHTRFPLPAKIREIVTPENYISAEDKAAEVAARICGAVSNYGWNNGRGAEAYIGPVGWQVVQRQGGWSYICENLGVRINPSTFQAQLRKQLETNFKYGVNTIEESVGARITGDRGGGLTQIGDITKLLAKRETETTGEE